MTRETKIGLLVGLAFIIVIGILLSDHLTQTNEPQQAPLTQVASNVRTGVAVPGASATTPPPQAVAPQTGTVTPHSPVPTQDELTPAKPPVEMIQVGGDAAKATAAAGATGAKPQTPQERGVTGIDSNSTVVARPVEPVSGSLSTVAKSFGEEVVPANGGSTSHTDTSTPSSPRPTNTTTSIASTAGMKQYTAVAGDSVYKIAAKMMGSGTKANRDALIAANPSLQQNANMVIAGKAYNIPSSASGTSSGSTSTSIPAPSAPAPAPSRIAIVADKPPTASEPAGNVYTVKSGDSLTKIAVEQCGTAGAVNAIMDLNKDLLKGGTTIRPNMKLRLPGKPVATAD